MKQGERVSVADLIWVMQVSPMRERDENGDIVWLARATIDNPHQTFLRYPELKGVFWERRGVSLEHAKSRLMDFIYWRVTMINWKEN